jgi:hypothetical protein
VEGSTPLQTVTDGHWLGQRVEGTTTARLNETIVLLGTMMTSTDPLQGVQQEAAALHPLALTTTALNPILPAQLDTTGMLVGKTEQINLSTDRFFILSCFSFYIFQILNKFFLFHFLKRTKIFPLSFGEK